MQAKAGLERLWAGCDTLLLVTVFILLGVVWYSNSREASAFGKATSEKRETSGRKSRFPMFSGKTVTGMRVSHESGRVNTIARSMVDSGWDKSPTFPAMDMREDGKVCDVLFTLPEGIAEDTVRVTAVGGVLTVTMKNSDSGEISIQRIRIPYGVVRPDTLQAVISNDVLRVRICPAGG
jgi:HSP20 family molecular chaperone IbpA